MFEDLRKYLAGSPPVRWGYNAFAPVPLVGLSKAGRCEGAKAEEGAEVVSAEEAD